MKERNLVHKHALNYHRCEKFKDKKKAKKKGYLKHKPSKSEGFLLIRNCVHDTVWSNKRGEI